MEVKAGVCMGLVGGGVSEKGGQRSRGHREWISRPAGENTGHLAPSAWGGGASV